MHVDMQGDRHGGTGGFACVFLIPRLRAALKRALVGAEPTRPEPVLTLNQHKFWHDNGFLILKGLIPQELIAAVNAEVESSGPIHLDSAVVRAALLSDRLVAILSELLHGAPLIVESLNLTSPPVPDNSVVTSICLEDVHPDAGPLFYYPGSHTIPPFTVETEMSSCHTYLASQIAARGLAKTAFVGVAGDVFLGHSHLLYGGLPARNSTRTRKSLLARYVQNKVG